MVTPRTAIGGAARLGVHRLDEAEESLRRYARETGIPGGESDAAAIIEGLRDPSRRDEAASVVLGWLDLRDTQSYWVVDWLDLLGAREQAIDVVERMFETSPHEASSINALMATKSLRGDPRFEAAVAALAIPYPPPAAVPVPW